MNKPFWPLAVNTWGDAEREAAHRIIDSGRLTVGEEVEAFEHEFAQYIGSRYAIMVNSGSSANLLAVATMMTRDSNIGSAIVPAIAWATTYAPLHQHNLALRIVDIDPFTLNVTDEAIWRAINDSTGVIVGCSILGNPAPVDKIRIIADSNELFFIEDNCESMGAKIGDQFCGTFGHIGTFSTFFSHHISTGEGGVLVTDDDELYELALCMRAHGWTRDLPAESPLRVRLEVAGDYQFVLPGYNLRPTELAAAVGRAQLQRLNEMNTRRWLNWSNFYNNFGADERWGIQSVSAGAVPFGFTLVFRNERECALAKQKLQAAGIEYRMITGGCFTEHPAASHYRWSAVDDLPNARYAHHCGLFIGNHPFNLSEQIARMAEVLK